MMRRCGSTVISQAMSLITRSTVCNSRAPLFQLSPGLMLRSVAQQRVSKHGAAPSFETRPSAAPQDEADRHLLLLIVSDIRQIVGDLQLDQHVVVGGILAQHR